MAGSFFKKLSQGLRKTRQGFLDALSSGADTGAGDVGEEYLHKLENALIRADVGAGFAAETIQGLRDELKGKETDENGCRDALANRLEAFFETVPSLPMNSQDTPRVVFVVGVNGVGKTTSIGKLASFYKSEGKSSVLCAGDTFRAAAVEQLKIWAEKTGAEFISHADAANPAAVIFDAIAHAKARGHDLVFADTAGRMHTQHNLMEELKKMARVAGKQMDGAPHETWLVLDATTGQSALAQARQFSDTLPITGLILTKLDGTAKGGVLIRIVDELKLPVRFVGVGEGEDDLIPFSPADYVQVLLREAP